MDERREKVRISKAHKKNYIDNIYVDRKTNFMALFSYTLHTLYCCLTRQIRSSFRSPISILYVAVPDEWTLEK